MNSFSLDPRVGDPRVAESGVAGEQSSVLPVDSPATAAALPAGHGIGRPEVNGPPRPARSGETFAALDLGTNNCRLLVARANGSGFRVIDAFSRIVRLGEGLGASGRLSEAAMERTIEALKICAGKIASRGVTRSRYVAT